MAPRRRAVLVAVAVLVALAVLGAVLASRPRAAPPVDQSQPGPVLLVPGYGGGVASLLPLAGALEAAGRPVSVVAAAGDGTGDLAGQARQLDAAARAALDAGAPSVDVVGYSAGGVVARVWLEGEGADAAVRRVVTLGSPHGGTEVAELAQEISPQQCPTACQQLVPGSSLLAGLAATPGSAVWTSIWTAADEVVTPPSTSQLSGAVGVELQAVCPASVTTHAGLARDPLPVALVVRALAVDPLAAPPGEEQCAALTAEGSALLASGGGGSAVGAVAAGSAVGAVSS